MILFILLAIFFAKIRRYHVTILFREVSMLPLWILEIIFWILQVCIWMEDYRFISLARWLQTANILVLLWPIMKFRLYPQAIAGAILTGAGSAMNRIVMQANGGRMPVRPSLSAASHYFREGALELSGDVRHLLAGETTKLNFLADYIDVGFSIMSPGDVLIHLFTTIVIYCVIAKCNQMRES